MTGRDDDWDDDPEDFETADDHSQLDAFGTDDSPADEFGNDVEIPVAFASNVRQTVTVAAHLNGAIAQIKLSPTAVDLTEYQLAQEIRAVAEVAAMKASAVIHVLTVQSLVEQGLDFAVAREFVATNMWFASPEDAQAAVVDLARRGLDAGD